MPIVKTATARKRPGTDKCGKDYKRSAKDQSKIEKDNKGKQTEKSDKKHLTKERSRTKERKRTPSSSASSSSSTRSRSSSSSSSSSSRKKRHVREKQRKRRSRSASHQRRRRSPTPRPKKVHIGRLTKNVNKDHLNEIFGLYGTVTLVELPLDRVFGVCRGFGYVEYERAEDADEAIKHMNGGQLDGETITVSAVLMPRFRPPAMSGMQQRRDPPRRRRNQRKDSGPDRDRRNQRQDSDPDRDRRRRPRSPVRRRSPRRRRSRSRSKSRSPIRRRPTRRSSSSSSR